ncbi:MAG: DUF1972 domain-containing protein [Crocinitomicaceae bacterium]|nr:DUF1972 domain-containing protein [Crocinitomicaceae bacterium]
MKISIVGTRGIPANYGGFETFAQEISVLLVEKGWTVTVFCDAPELGSEPLKSFNGVKLQYSRTTKSKNPLLYYYSTIREGLKTSDIVLVTGTGGAFFYFLNFFRRKKIITNCDGVESRRAKWGFLKKTFIRFTESFAMRFSTAIIADSKGIENYLTDKYSKNLHSKIHTIEYGAPVNNSVDPEVLNKYNLVSQNYYLVVSRLEPENNIQLIIKGYLASKSTLPLVIIGNLIDNDYVKSVQQLANEKVLFIGGVYNQHELSALRTSCTAYIHGHSVGGTNPSLLEALGSSNVCICHDNIFNREVTMNEMFYFSNVQNFAEAIDSIEQLSSEQRSVIERSALNRINEYYNWQNMANKYSTLFTNLIDQQTRKNRPK